MPPSSCALPPTSDRYGQPQPQHRRRPPQTAPAESRSPSFPIPLHTSARRTALLLTAAAVALTASACSTSSNTHDSTTATPHRTAQPTPAAEPALAKHEALAQIARYSKINNKANAAGDTKLLDTIEDGPLYAMSSADFKEEAALPRPDREPYRPWSYDLHATDVYVPRVKPGQQRWFAAVTRSGSKKQYARMLVLAENTKAKRWEMVAAVDLDDPEQLPDITLDKDGYATAVDASSTSLSAPVGVLRTAIADNFATGGEKTGKKVFTPTEASRRQIKVHDQTTRKFGTRGTTRFASADTQFPDAYALKTASGALVIFSHTHTQHDAVAAPGLQIVPDKLDRAWLNAPAPAFTYTFTCSDVAAVPATPKPSSLLGYGCRRTDAKATGPDFSL
ncbi:hypothetical protein ABZX74_23780 [Streptomyces olivaceoviridis]|uniref:hypothetical protein n=1 Tax=Streptomyces olivaceoviridis TaxID=1921 RepID=UPI0033BE91D6